MRVVLLLLALLLMGRGVGLLVSKGVTLGNGAGQMDIARGSQGTQKRQEVLS